MKLHNKTVIVSACLLSCALFGSTLALAPRTSLGQGTDGSTTKILQVQNNNGMIIGTNKLGMPVPIGTVEEITPLANGVDFATPRTEPIKLEFTEELQNHVISKGIDPDSVAVSKGQLDVDRCYSC